MADYKLPKCFLGTSRTVFGLNGEQSQEVITEDDVNLACECLNGMQAFWCSEGHLAECHVGKSCEEAECSHYERERRFEKNIDPDDGEGAESFDEEDDCS